MSQLHQEQGHDPGRCEGEVVFRKVRSRYPSCLDGNRPDLPWPFYRVCLLPRQAPPLQTQNWPLEQRRNRRPSPPGRVTGAKVGEDRRETEQTRDVSERQVPRAIGPGTGRQERTLDRRRDRKAERTGRRTERWRAHSMECHRQ